jgi:hypothetical protein
MIIQAVDPRDVESEMKAVYRVFFWSDQRRRSDEFELTEVQHVQEVLDWIEVNANGREVEAMVVVERCAAYLIGPLDHSGKT